MPTYALTYPDVCRRMLTYALTYALTHALKCAVTYAGKLTELLEALNLYKQAAQESDSKLASKVSESFKNLSLSLSLYIYIHKYL